MHISRWLNIDKFLIFSNGKNKVQILSKNLQNIEFTDFVSIEIYDTVIAWNTENVCLAPNTHGNPMELII